MTLQPFLNYNLPKGWYLTASPLITANWETGEDNRWTVPIGGGIGRIFNIGHQAINTNLTAYYNVVTPTTRALTGNCALSGHFFSQHIEHRLIATAREGDWKYRDRLPSTSKTIAHAVDLVRSR